MFRFRHIIAALILVAASAASLNSVGARVVHPIVFSPSAAAAAPASDGRRLFAAAGHDQLMALCQQVARARTKLCRDRPISPYRLHCSCMRDGMACV